MSQSIKALRAMLEEGISLTEASARYGITKAAISKVKHHPTKKLKILYLQDKITDLTRKLDLARLALEGIREAYPKNSGTAIALVCDDAISAIKEK